MILLEKDSAHQADHAPRIIPDTNDPTAGHPTHLFDHIFVSHALVGKIAQDHVTTDVAGPTPSIDDDPPKRRGAPGSDHRPVLASINV